MSLKRRRKEETYFKNRIKKATNVSPVLIKRWKSDVGKALTEQGASYVRHRSHVANIKNSLPLICESFNGKYIEMDFSGLSKSRTRISRGSTSTISTQKYFYHLSDDTTHDPEFVHEVLVDLFDKFSIKNETIMIKSDNAPT